MTHHGGRKMTDMWQSAGASEATVAPTPLLLRSTVFQDGSRDSCPSDRSFEQLLLEHCERILSGGRSQTLIVQLELGFEGSCPETHEKTVLRVADELLSNAMEHGFYCRERGHVFVHVVSRAGVGVQVSVSDDGWGFDSGQIVDGNGFHLLRMIGDLYVGPPSGPLGAKTAVIVIIPFRHCHAVNSLTRGDGREGERDGPPTSTTLPPDPPGEGRVQGSCQPPPIACQRTSRNFRT
jgi:hypothetical protein